MNKLKNKEQLLPFRVVGLEELLDEEDVNIIIEVCDCKNCEMVSFSILRSDLNAKSLKRAISKNKGIVPADINMLVRMTEQEVNRMLMSGDDSIWNTAHFNTGYIERDGELEFDSCEIIMKDSVLNSRYYGRFDIVPKGDFSAVLKMFEVLNESDSPAIPLLMLGATATVLAFSNHIWNTHAYNFLVHLSGTSSTGKSTLAKAIASFGGCPEGSNGFFISFLGTMNAIVKMVTNIHGIPICIDEFSASKYQKDWSNFIYTLSNGYDKERCVAGGNSIMATASFETVFVTTGEVSLQGKCNKNEGIKARLFEIDTDFEYTKGISKFTSSAEESDFIKTVVTNNYGHLSPLIAKELMQKESFYNERRVIWLHVLEERYSKDNYSLNVADRVFVYISLIMVACEVIESILSLKFDLKRILDYYYFHFVEKNAEDGNLWEKVYDLVKRMISENKYRLVDLICANGVPALSENQVGYEIDLSYGRANKDRHKDADGNYCDYLYVFPIDFVEKYFKERGFDDVESKIKVLKKKKLIKYVSSGCKYKLDVDGTPTPTYAFWMKKEYDPEIVRKEFGI